MQRAFAARFLLSREPVWTSLQLLTFHVSSSWAHSRTYWVAGRMQSWGVGVVRGGGGERHTRGSPKPNRGPAALTSPFPIRSQEGWESSGEWACPGGLAWQTPYSKCQSNHGTLAPEVQSLTLEVPLSLCCVWRQYYNSIIISSL